MRVEERATSKIRTTAALAAATVAMAGVVLAPGQPALAAGHDRHENGPIALAAVTVADGAYGPFEIATVRTHGAPYRFLTSLPNGAFNPDFTPDGRRILFWSPVDAAPDAIFWVPVGGGALHQIPTGCSDSADCLGDDNPAVSPDGRTLLAVRALGPFDENGCPAFVGIFSFRIDGSHARQISPPASDCVADFEPRWSPDGRRIVFRRGDQNGNSLWVMDADGRHRHQITPAGLDVGAPDWSPDGNRIVFQSPDETPDDQTPQQLFTIRPDGSGLVQLTHYPIVAGLLVKTNGPRWSPEGNKIVFAHLDATTTTGPDGLYHADLFVMNPDSSGVVQINATLEKDNMPAWGPRPAHDPA